MSFLRKSQSWHVHRLVFSNVVDIRKNNNAQNTPLISDINSICFLELGKTDLMGKPLGYSKLIAEITQQNNCNNAIAQGYICSVQMFS